ncbi:MAG: penicillin-binding transpeptidase domain-containing protein [Bacillota bacterium]|nr:penicillin-binding transpeptidase domain-containing protein [Bacillota bacterium]
MESMTKNLKKTAIIGIVLMALLICRLAYIQLVGGTELAEATRAQSLISLEGSNTRGIIYDRTGSALVADKKQYVYIIKEENFDYQTAKLLKETGAREVSSDNEGYYVYSSESYDKNMGKKLIEKYHAYILQASARYGEDQTAAHLIGYVNQRDSSGASGLELMFDEELSVLNRNIYAVADVKGNILPGRGLLITEDSTGDSYVKEGINTTVGKELQGAVEEIIEEEGKDCAVVVLDSRSGGIMAMACTPAFDPNDVSSYLEADGDQLINKATQGEYAPGSVFKIIVAAAALEKGVDESKTYTCTGETQVGGLSIGCETGGEEGHGSIDFETAFADSCNSFFIQLGQEIGSDAIIHMAEKFHLGEKTLKGYPQEKAGHLMTKAERQGAAIGNLSIGQGETLVTPIQIARMTNIIAAGGIDRGVHILMEDEVAEEQVISGNTAKTIGSMMEGTVKMGTARTLELTGQDDMPEAAVKTGTAEYVQDGEMATHGWITGYTPSEEPEYTITVFMEDGSSGGNGAGGVFEKIVAYLKESGSYSKPTLA